MELMRKSDFGDGKSSFGVGKSNFVFRESNYGVGKSNFGFVKSDFGVVKSDFGVGQSNLRGQSNGATKTLGKTKTVITKPASHGVLPCSVPFNHPSFFKPFKQLTLQEKVQSVLANILAIIMWIPIVLVLVMGAVILTLFVIFVIFATLVNLYTGGAYICGQENILAEAGGLVQGVVISNCLPASGNCWYQ